MKNAAAMLSTRPAQFDSTLRIRTFELDCLGFAAGASGAAGGGGGGGGGGVWGGSHRAGLWCLMDEALCRSPTPSRDSLARLPNSGEQVASSAVRIGGKCFIRRDICEFAHG